jgi:hypothetical protein
MRDNGWDRALKVTADGTGLVGHAGAVLFRKAADQAGLTAQLSGTLRKKGSSPAFDRGTVLVSLAAAIALGATGMSDIALLVHLAPVFGGRSERADGAPCPGPGRGGCRAGPDRPRQGESPRARRDLIQDTPAGSRGWRSPGRRWPAGWLVIDMEATLATARSDKQGAAPTWKKGYGFHPAGAWCASTRECLAMLLRPGNAGSNTFTDHEEVLGAGSAAGPHPVPAQDPRPR